MPALRDKILLALIVISLVVGVILYRNRPDAVPSASAPAMTGLLTPPDSVDELDHYLSMYRAHPNHAPIALQIAQIYSQRSLHTEAIRYYRTFLQIDTSSTAWESRLDLAKEFFAAGLRDSARAEIAALEQLHGDHPGVLYNSGAIAANDGDFVKAKANWEKVLRISPQSEEGKLAARGLDRIKN